MLEQRRQQYLSVLGIENYVPRRIVPGAAPSTLLPDEYLLAPLSHSVTSSVEVDSGPEKGEINVLGTQLDPTNVADVSSLLRNLQGKHEKNEASLEPAIETRGASEETAAENKVSDVSQQDADSEKSEWLPINFTLSVWRISDDCLVIDSREPGTALPTDRLLQNMLRAMDYSVVQLPPSEIIRWPVFIGDKFAKKKNGNSITKEQYEDEANQAQAMVQAYVTAQITKMPIKTLILMGKDAALYSLGYKANFAELQGSFIESSPWQANVIVTPSLFSMLQEPLQKEIAWAALQSIPR